MCSIWHKEMGFVFIISKQQFRYIALQTYLSGAPECVYASCIHATSSQPATPIICNYNCISYIAYSHVVALIKRLFVCNNF